MLCFPQMATQAQVRAEQYLHMTFEHDADLISRRRSLYTALGLQNAASLALADYPLELTPAVVFSDL
jgi:hypothetical protein